MKILDREAVKDYNIWSLQLSTFGAEELGDNGSMLANVDSSFGEA